MGSVKSLENNIKLLAAMSETTPMTRIDISDQSGVSVSSFERLAKNRPDLIMTIKGAISEGAITRHFNGYLRRKKGSTEIRKHVRKLCRNLPNGISFKP